MRQLLHRNAPLSSLFFRASDLKVNSMNARSRLICVGSAFAILFFLHATALLAAAPKATAPRIAEAKPEKMLVFIGTYTRGKSKGIYSGELELATGKLSITGVTPSVEPSFLAIDPTGR